MHSLHILTKRKEHLLKKDNGQTFVHTEEDDGDDDDAMARFCFPQSMQLPTPLHVQE